MATLKSGLVLADDEKLVMEIEAELWAVSSNPIARIIGGIAKFIGKILGFKKKGFWVVTDKRVFEVEKQIACYCITTGRRVKYVLPSSVTEIGYTKSTVFGCFCPAYHLYYRTLGSIISNQVMLKGADEAGAAKAATSFYAAISNKNA